MNISECLKANSFSNQFLKRKKSSIKMILFRIGSIKKSMTQMTMNIRQMMIKTKRKTKIKTKMNKMLIKTKKMKEKKMMILSKMMISNKKRNLITTTNSISRAKFKATRNYPSLCIKT